MTSEMKYLQFEKITPEVNPETTCADGQEPDPRSGHRIVADESNLYSIGGYNPDFNEVPNEGETYYPLFRELWRFNFASRKWKRLRTKGHMPVELASHSATLYGNHLLVFGGTGVPFGDAATNQLHRCNLLTLQWDHLECTGDFPIRVYGHTMTIVDDGLYIFGGTTGWEYNSELHRLNLTTLHWDIIQMNGDIPEGRYRHEVGCYNRRMYVFGGGRSYTVYQFDSIPCFSFDTCTWELVATQPDEPAGFPRARRCHTCVQNQKDAYICGGYDGQEIFGDIWKIDLEAMKWTRLQARMPEPAYFHSAALMPVGCMVIYGGVVDIDTVRTSSMYRLWLKIPTLKEMCWQRIAECHPDLDQMSKSTLVELGIPLDLAERLPRHHQRRHAQRGTVV